MGSLSVITIIPGNHCHILNQFSTRWNAARAFAVFLERNYARFCRERNVLELGAGGGLPGIIAALCGAKKVFTS